MGRAPAGDQPARLITRDAEFIDAGERGWWARSGLVDAQDLALLRQCLRFATLEEHVGTLIGRFGLGDEARAGLRRSLQRLRSSGHLLDEQELLAHGATGCPARIQSVGILSRDRPACLQRVLADWGPAMVAQGRRLIIADDGEDARQIPGGLGLQAEWLHRRHRQRWLDRLPDPHWREMAAWGLGLDQAAVGRMTVGANTNALLLATPGEALVSFDDDLCAPLVRASHWRADELELAGEGDPTELLLFDDDAQLEQSFVVEADDPVSLHEAWLGQPVRALAATRPVQFAADFGPGQAQAVSAGGRVRLTMLGLAGDSGMSSPTWYLGLQGQAGERLDAAYGRRLLSRQVLRSSPFPRIASSRFYMSSCVGMDQRSLLPPYMPLDRNSDGLFGCCVRRVCEDSFTAFLPWALRHRPPERRRYGREDLWNVIRAPSLNELLMSALGDWEPAPGLRDSAARCRALGRFFEACGTQSPRAYVEWQRHEACRRDFQRLQWLQHLLETTPPHRHADLREGIANSRAQLARQQAGAICMAGQSVEDYRATVAQFGRWLQLWPELLAHAEQDPLRGEAWSLA